MPDYGSTAKAIGSFSTGDILQWHTYSNGHSVHWIDGGPGNMLLKWKAGLDSVSMSTFTYLSSVERSALQN